MLLKSIVRTSLFAALQLGLVLQVSAKDATQNAATQDSVANTAVSTAVVSDADFPAAGKAVEVVFGDAIIDLNFKDLTTLSIFCRSGIFKGITETVQYTAVKIRPQVYMVYWHEPESKLNVVHVEDFEHGTVYTNVTYPDGKFVHFKGTIKIVGNAK
ncbi:Metallo-beta-lactamase superfamily protein [Collimonas arenae]|uniref:Metallo-beta-lactamase superfamily protein n=1 Tax=Collimonas arenae TaxID=279058 RepID=A0A0A1FBA3_9BURK|nr:hypothetical protein [Collimonas arenae]AIY41776.1 Metallo-beta-lactamase superfamily protein [Collimonas arenae]